MIPNLNEICTCCGGYENQPILQLFDDKCFRIVDQKETHGEFCLKDFAFPTDGYSCMSLNVELDGGEMTIFDNQTLAISPSGVLETDKLYARGVMIRIVYPTNDTNGEEIAFVNKSVKIEIENAEPLVSTQYPMYDFFMIFTNPKSNKTEDLINKIKIINPNLLYKIRINALILFGKAI